MRREAHSAKRAPRSARSKILHTAAKAIGGCVALVAVVLGITNAVVVGKTSPRIVSADEAGGHGADAILVLGAYVRPDGTPSDILCDRLDNAIALYRAGAAPKIILSGDHGSPSYDELDGMKRYALDKGVPEEDLFCDHAGFSTYESMYRAKSIFGAERIIVSTQTYHLYRALYDAAGLGVDAVGVPSDFHTFAQQPLWDIREAPARSKDFFYVLMQIPPTFEGEPIDLRGSGTVTNG